MSFQLIKAISLVIPVHNESGNVEKLMDELGQLVIGNVLLEFIFVDDYSADNTVEKLLALQKK